MENIVKVPCVETLFASKFGFCFGNRKLGRNIEGQALNAGRLVRDAKHINLFSLEEGLYLLFHNPIKLKVNCL